MNRILVLSFGVLSVFATAALIFAQIIPRPHGASDYLVIGTAATFAAMVVLFVVLITTWVKHPDLFFRRRRREEGFTQSTGRTSTSA